MRGERVKDQGKKPLDPPVSGTGQAYQVRDDREAGMTERLSRVMPMQ